MQVDWEEVWEAALGAGRVTLLLRLGLDDGQQQVAAAAAKALLALLAPSPQEQALLSLSDLCPLPGEVSRRPCLRILTRISARIFAREAKPLRFALPARCSLASRLLTLAFPPGGFAAVDEPFTRWIVNLRFTPASELVLDGARCPLS